MKNLKIFGIMAFFGLFVSFWASVNAQDGTNDPVQIFKSQKCNSCHSVDILNIQKSNKSSKAPDLSEVGTKYEIPFFVQYLKKEAEIDGKKHSITYKGTDPELGALAGWLTTLRGQQTPKE